MGIKSGGCDWYNGQVHTPRWHIVRRCVRWHVLSLPMHLTTPFVMIRPAGVTPKLELFQCRLLT
jgi:hypothetical protein